MDEAFQQTGFKRLANAISVSSMAALQASLDAAPEETFRQRRNGSRYAIRNVHLQLPGLRSLLEQGPLLKIASEVLSGTAKLVSATLFDKLPGANWFVPPHQDLFVPISGSTDDARWTNWSTKGGVKYVEPPVDVQRELLAVRVHLDKCPERNGALEVVPGSHLDRLNETAVALIKEDAFKLCPAGPGDVLLMRPLLVHRSRAAELPRRRRVLHVVYSAVTLSEGLSWT